MSFREIQQLADRYAKRIVAHERDQDFHAQRVKMWHFYMYFYSTLRADLGKMEGDIRTLKETGFDRKMLHLYIKVYHELLELMKSTNKDKPYIMAEQFVKYMLGGWGSKASVLENLDFLIQHHLKMNETDIVPGRMIGHSNIDTLGSLKELAQRVKAFIESNPSLPIPGMGGSEPPVALPEPLPTATPQDKTYVPQVKKLLV